MVPIPFSKYSIKREALTAQTKNAYRTHLHGGDPNKRIRPRDVDPQQHFCIVQTTKGRIIGYGDNHTPVKEFLPTIHAEGKALANAAAKIHAERGSGYTRRLKVDVIVGRTNGGNSRPCSECSRNLFTNPHFTVRQVIYTDPDGDRDNGYTTTRTTTLYETRFQHITKHNLRRMGFVNPDTNALFNPFNPDATINGEQPAGFRLDALPNPPPQVYDTPAIVAVNNTVDTTGDHHCHGDDQDEMDDEDEDDGEAVQHLDICSSLAHG